MDKKHCEFCVNNAKTIDYKNTAIFEQSISRYKKILPPKYTGACSKHQRKLARAIKNARIMALLPFVPEMK